MPSWADDVLKCVPLRDAVYRNRTPDRGLRHAVSLGCLPFRSFAAVAPWLPPWDIVPPAEACAKAESLEITSHRNWRQTVADVVKVAGIMTQATSCPGGPDTQRHAPFSKVASLSLSVSEPTAFYGSDIDEFHRALQCTLRCLPALEALVLDNLSATGCEHPLWLADTPLALVDMPGKWPGKLEGEHAIAAYRSVPRLTTLDIRRRRPRDWEGRFFTSLLLCRGTLKTVSCGDVLAVSALVDNERCGQKAPEFRIRHASETPPCPEPESIELTANQRVPASVVPRVPVHWTLETLVVDPCRVPPQSAPMQQLVLMCPRLKAITLRQRNTGARDFEKEISTLSLQSSWPVFAVSLARDDVATYAGTSAPCPPPVTDHETFMFEAFQHYRFPSTVLQEQLDAMHVAHRYVQAVVAAYAADRNLLPAALSRHRVGLDAVVDGGAYPAALLWAFARGPEHTTLQSVNLVGLLAPSDVASVEAVVAFAARQRRTERRSQHGPT